MWGERKDWMKFDKRRGVRGELSEKKKTGLEFEFAFSFFRDFRAATGQQLWLLNSKMSTNSPDGYQFFLRESLLI